MKKTLAFALFTLLVLMLVTSACKLPAPGGAPPTEAEDSSTAAPPTEEAASETEESDAAEKPTEAATDEQATSSPQDSAAEKPTAVPATATHEAAAEPTATPVPSEETTAEPVSDAQRIKFASGAESATVSGELDSGATANFVLYASAGQTMNVQVWSPNADVYLAVSDSDGKVLLDGDDEETQWTGELSTTDDYYLSATASGGRTSYSITVIIPAGTAAETSTATPAPTKSGSVLDPYKTFGTPDYRDEFDLYSSIEWANPDGTLPNTPEIRLHLDDDDFLVTGKIMDFSTWWFNWASLEDFYIELTVNTRKCADQDAYGLILRGPAHLAGVSYGYVVSFTCDGSLWVYRLDGVKPWSSVDLVSVTEKTEINKGSNAENVIGVRAMGDTLYVYANGVQVAKIVDRYYLEGRFGLFVRPDATDYYTYEAVKIAYWIFDE